MQGRSVPAPACSHVSVPVPASLAPHLQALLQWQPQLRRRRTGLVLPLAAERTSLQAKARAMDQQLSGPTILAAEASSTNAAVDQERDGAGSAEAALRLATEHTEDGVASSGAGTTAAPVQTPKERSRPAGSSGNGAEASLSSRYAGNGASGDGRAKSMSGRSGRRGLSAFLRAKADRRRPAAVQNPAAQPARRSPPRVPPGPPQRQLPPRARDPRTSPGPSSPAARSGVFGWLGGLRERLRSFRWGREQVEYVSLDFKRGGTRGGVVDPFAPSAEPPAPREVPDLGTMWGLLVLGVAYVHHSTTGCAQFLSYCILGVRIEAKPSRNIALGCLSSKATPVPFVALALKQACQSWGRASMMQTQTYGVVAGMQCLRCCR